MIGTNAGPRELAGKMCHELFFTSWQNDKTPEAMGKFMADRGITGVYAMAPDYAGGKDAIAGFKRYYKGKIVAEVYTKLGEQDYRAAISQLRAAKPKAVFIFYPGGMGIQFLRQNDEAGLREQIPLFSVYTVDEISLLALKDAAEGQWKLATGARISRTRQTSATLRISGRSTVTRPSSTEPRATTASC